MLSPRNLFDVVDWAQKEPIICQSVNLCRTASRGHHSQTADVSTLAGSMGLLEEKKKSEQWTGKVREPVWPSGKALGW